MTILQGVTRSSCHSQNDKDNNGWTLEICLGLKGSHGYRIGDKHTEYSLLRRVLCRLGTRKQDSWPLRYPSTGIMSNIMHLTTGVVDYKQIARISASGSPATWSIPCLIAGQLFQFQSTLEKEPASVMQVSAWLQSSFEGMPFIQCALR